MKHSVDEIEQLRAALRFSSGNELADSMARGSLLSGVIRDDEELLNVYVQEVGPPQAVLDLHLEGSGVSGHTTNALSFGKFVSGIAEAVKETVKASLGKQRLASDLLIEGPGQGSVRLVLRVPNPDDVPSNKSDNHEDQDALDAPSTVQSEALRTISQLLNLASVDDDAVDTALDIRVSKLPVAARTKLNGAMEQALAANWDIQGNIEQRVHGKQNVTLPKRGAARLKVALTANEKKTDVMTMLGNFDGFKYSTGTVWFIPQEGPKFSAAVDNDDLLHRVAAAAADSNFLVSAQFEVITILNSTKSSELRKSRRLLSIDRAPETNTLF
ncbi:hypothetical protein [Arthrobacter sp. MYb213]|uniref:hypothetical protein n=1 Tax=Arthrobacter sp. MYb213 TaxID=1848595 RepID=UPI000CFB13CA|nr:hypothetical protein [Arthrobacter sp. MYb213]PRB69486.1 hypothetical protein CQ011_12040 [Arthrobacter sp. MYb213]